MLRLNTQKGFPLGSLFFIIAVTSLAFHCNDQDPETHSTKVLNTLATPDTTLSLLTDTTAPTTYTIIGVGDMMLGTNYPSSSYLPANGGKDMLAKVRDTLLQADVTFGNLEGTILNEGGTAKRCNNPDACYVFRSPESYGQHFQDAGFDLLSLANNHSGDFGPTGRTRTKAVLDEVGIKYAGLAGTDEWAVYEKDGIRYGLCAFAPNSGTCDVRKLSRAKEIVQELDARADIIIVSFHGGAEGSKHQHVPRATETYYGENRGNVYAFAHAVIDAGADIVFGHGPHVTRAAELYKDRFIIYSMGNFCTYGRFNVRGVAGIAPIIRLQVDEAGAFVSGKAISIYQEKPHGPWIDPQNRAVQTLKSLTETDFPETALLILPDGTLTRK